MQAPSPWQVKDDGEKKDDRHKKSDGKIISMVENIVKQLANCYIKYS
jgi:hypothetical protein